VLRLGEMARGLEHVCESAKTANDVPPFAAADRFIGLQIVLGLAGMCIDDAERGILPREIDKDARQEDMLEHIGEIAGVESVLIIHSRELKRRGNAKLARAARPLRDLRTGAELAQILGKADAHFFEHTGAAGDPHHVRPKFRVSRNESPFYIDRCPGLAIRGGAKRRRDFHRIARASHVGEIVRRAFARAGTVLTPFVAREIDVGIYTLRSLKRDARRRAAGGPAILRKSRLVLRPEAVHEEAQPRTGCTLAAGLLRAPVSQKPGDQESERT